ncbi:MAG: hypothetical protein M3020_10980, partial [Myxococcota bacterium]|nr:hypothetical protein [Myxococcota bacterium]
MPPEQKAAAQRRRTALSVGVAILFGLSLGVLLLPFGATPDDGGTPLPKTLLLGRELAPNDAANQTALARVRSYL